MPNYNLVPFKQPVCPKCGAVMKRASVMLGLSQIGERTFVCRRCRNVEVIDVPENPSSASSRR
jgi:tRNA(Ile2) C34 agmatinyltransferase TiaS